MTRKLYAGIGSRETPPDMIDLMREFAYLASLRGWVLRSGAAQGADSAFELGCDDAKGEKEIFIPWPNFNNHYSQLIGPTDAAMRVAEAVHPTWKRLSPAAKKLVARNMHQIMGANMDEPVLCVVCWTPDGCENIKEYSRKTGGTGTAISFASTQGIPVFNFKHHDRYVEAVEYMLFNS